MPFINRGWWGVGGEEDQNPAFFLIAVTGVENALNHLNKPQTHFSQVSFCGGYGQPYEINLGF